MLAERKPLPVAEVTLDPAEIQVLGYFVRDLRELLGSALMKDGPGSLNMTGHILFAPGSNPTLETAVTDDEIRSFATIFRRLYMDKEPANFLKAVTVFVKAMGGHPNGKWAEASAKEYEKHLDSIANNFPPIPVGTRTFQVSRLIDVFIYTQYAHQPDGRRQRQFNACLQEVHGSRDTLTWMFLTVLSVKL